MRARPGHRAWHRRYVGHSGDLGEHVFGQRQHHRAGSAGGSGLEGTRNVFGDALHAVDLRDPFGHLAEHAAVVDFLERLAVDEVAADLADEQDHRRGILERGVHADAGVGRARPARAEDDAGAAGQLAVGVGHVGRAALLPADDEARAVAALVEAFEHAEVAFARHAEGEVDAVIDQRIDEDLAAVAGCGIGARGAYDCCLHGGGSRA